jgi:hypothetical protein
MCAMLTEMSIPISDLRYLCVKCGECGTQIILDLDGKRDISQCPACHEKFDPLSVCGNIDQIAGAYKQLKSAKHKFSFRIPVAE